MLRALSSSSAFTVVLKRMRFMPSVCYAVVMAVVSGLAFRRWAAPGGTVPVATRNRYPTTGDRLYGAYQLGRISNVVVDDAPLEQLCGMLRMRQAHIEQEVAE
jgi:hypothetical protein